MKTRTVYICEVCGEEHAAREAAEACERIPTSLPLFKVGDELKITRGQDKDEIVEIIEWSYIRPTFAGDRFSHKVIYTVEFSNGDMRSIIEDVLDYGVV